MLKLVKLHELPHPPAVEHAVLCFFFLVQVALFLYFRRLFPNDDETTIQGLEGNSQAVAIDLDMESAFAYVRSFNDFRRKLNFVHIPKNAGTAIEQAAAENGIAWGNCRFKHRPKRKICPSPSGEDWPANVGWWHVPTQFFPLAHVNPYDGSELFAVVRDPLQRMVSEFYYSCTLKNKEWRPNHCAQDKLHDPNYLSSWLSQKFQRNNQHGSHPALRYVLDNGHFTSQYEFLVGPHQVRIVDYVLVMDHDEKSLKREFQKLMKAFRLPLALRHMQSISSHHEEGGPRSPLLTARNLTKEVTSQIQTLCRDDMDLLERLMHKADTHN